MIKRLIKGWKEKKKEKRRVQILKDFKEYACSKFGLWNGGAQCDILYHGPCACGAWHDYKELIRRVDRKGYSSTTWAQFRYQCAQDGIRIPEEVLKYALPQLNKYEW